MTGTTTFTQQSMLIRKANLLWLTGTASDFADVREIVGYVASAGCADDLNTCKRIRSEVAQWLLSGLDYYGAHVACRHLQPRTVLPFDLHEFDVKRLPACTSFPAHH